MTDHDELTKYDTKRQAVAAARAQQGPWGTELWRVWWCDRCGSWHTTSWKDYRA